jgi:hypothetical protein
MRNLTVTVSAHAPYVILSTSSNLCTILDYSMPELQGSRICIMFGPESNMSVTVSAMKAVHMDLEHQATILAGQIYALNCSCHSLDIRSDALLL